MTAALGATAGAGESTSPGVPGARACKRAETSCWSSVDAEDLKAAAAAAAAAAMNTDGDANCSDR